MSDNPIADALGIEPRGGPRHFTVLGVRYQLNPATPIRTECLVRQSGQWPTLTLRYTSVDRHAILLGRFFAARQDIRDIEATEITAMVRRLL